MLWPRQRVHDALNNRTAPPTSWVQLRIKVFAALNLLCGAPHNLFVVMITLVCSYSLESR